MDNTLKDICNVKIDTTLSFAERQQSYLQQLGNPYLYKCDDVTVRISFADTEVTFEDRIKQLLMALCTA